VEGREPPPEPLVPEHLAYGEAYGVFQVDAIRELLRGGDDVAQLFAETASRVELHADAMRDVALTVRVTGEEAAAMDDLAKALAGALAAARVAANGRGERELFELLESAKVRPGAGELQLEVAVPVATLERWFAPCLDDARRAAAR
jgi:hypothetical protein